MMTALTCSRRNCFARNIPSPMIMAEVSSGLVNLEESENQPLVSQHNSLQPSKTNLPKPNHPLNIAHQKLNAVNLPSCYEIWSIPPSSHPNSTPKSTGKSSVRISEFVPTLFSATMDMSPNCSGMGCSCTLAIPKPMKMILTEQYARGWVSSLRWKT